MMKTFVKTVLAFGVVALLAAPAWAQQGRGFGMFGGGTALLSNKGVQSEIKASDDQVSKLNALAEDMRGKQREQFQKLQDVPEEQRAEKGRELGRTLNAEIRKNLVEILKPEQLKRYEQIQTQQAGPAAFDTPRVLDALNLTDDQKSKIREINEGLLASMRELFPNFQNDREGTMRKIADARKEATGKAIAVLTAAQKETWKNLTGEPYEVRFEPRPQN
jgi:hypothetical protein